MAKVFIVGPGFIGWNIVDLLIGEGYQVTGYVRREEHAKALQTSGATTVMGDLEDKAKITKQVTEHDIVFHTATADHLPSVEAILDGARQRAKKGLATIFIHTSGTSVLDDGAHGGHKSNKVFRDNVRSEIDSVPDDAPHRKIDLAIVTTQKELGEKAKIAIMIPPLIYGFNLQHQRLSIQMPTLTRFAIKHGFVGHVGRGLAVESNIHVPDLARAYAVLLHHLENESPASVLENPYYFCEATGDNEPSWKDIAETIGQGLQKAGRISDPEPREIPESMYGDLFGSSFTAPAIGLNSRSRAVRLRKLGWKPTEKDWRMSFLDDELPKILEEGNCTDFAGYAGVVAS